MPDVLVATEYALPAGLYEDAVLTADAAYTSVLADAGMSLDRDSSDERLIAEITTGTVTYTGTSGQAGIIDNHLTVGGWPTVLEEILTDLGTSGDGIPDSWKISQGLDVSTNYGVAGTFAGNPTLYDTDTESPTYGYRWVEIYSMYLTGEIDPVTPPTEYTLTVTSTSGGVVNTVGGTFEFNDEVNLIATPSSGFQFVGWRTLPTNEIISTQANFNYLVLGTASLQAVFQVIPTNSGKKFIARRKPIL